MRVSPGRVKARDMRNFSLSTCYQSHDRRGDLSIQNPPPHFCMQVDNVDITLGNKSVASYRLLVLLLIHAQPRH